ncbi:MAG: S8 family serine peptidase, partial [Chloroflexota bacterium]
MCTTVHWAWRVVIALVVVCAALWPGGGLGAQASRSDGLAAPALGERLIVRLEEPPALAAVGASSDLAREDALASRLVELHRQQTAVAAQVTSRWPGAQIERRYALAFNGLAVRLPAADTDAVETLRRLPGVSGVTRETAFAPALYASADTLDAKGLWAGVGGRDKAGEGMRIAILDSGIRADHPMLAPAGLRYPAGYPKGDARHASARVIVARAYFRPADPPATGEETPAPGLEGSPHGTALASAAAGRVIEATYQGITRTISGVAPRAWLMNYRIFYPSTQGGPEMALTAEVLQAIEDAVADGAHVLCLGWAGQSPTSPLASPVAAALDVAMAAGVVVVAAAGNDGPAPGSASRIPGGLERVISVGAATKGQQVATDLLDAVAPQPSPTVVPVPPSLTGQPFARARFGPAITAPLEDLPYGDVSLASPSGSPYACAPLPTASLQGYAALIWRGDCPFADKAYHAQQAGAALAILVNDSDVAEEMGCAGTYCDPGEITIPTIMIGATLGDDLLDWYEAHEDARLRVDPTGRVVPTTPHVLAATSARGPAYGRWLKPDLVAPGVAVLAASYGADGALQYEQASGTSIAAAQIAGAAAVLRQAHPTWRQDEVRAALMSTARPDVLRAAGGATADSLQRGAGAARLAHASAADALPAPPSLAVPELRPGQVATLALSLRDLRTWGATRTWTIATSASGHISVTAPTTLSLAPNSAKEIAVTVSAGATATPGEATGALTLASGSGNGAISLTVPLWARITPPVQSADVLVIDNDFSEFESYRDYASFVTAALSAAAYSYQVWNADLR